MGKRGSLKGGIKYDPFLTTKNVPIKLCPRLTEKNFDEHRLCLFFARPMNLEIETAFSFRVKQRPLFASRVLYCVLKRQNVLFSCNYAMSKWSFSKCLLKIGIERCLPNPNRKLDVKRSIKNNEILRESCHDASARVIHALYCKEDRMKIECLPLAKSARKLVNIQVMFTHLQREIIKALGNAKGAVYSLWKIRYSYRVWYLFGEKE